MYQAEKAESLKIVDGKEIWKIQSVTPKYQNYVLIIGESARADYHSLYGFPLNTTPYLTNSKGYVLDNFIAPASNTQLSLTRMLNLSKNDKVSYAHNIISLANTAGFKTYWFSTQPKLKEDETIATRIGMRANFSIFHDFDAYVFEKRMLTKELSDFILVKDLEASLQQNKNSNKPTLYILHINGSHPIFCNNLLKPTSETFKNKDMSCYLETIKQTDALLSEIEHALQPYGSYSMLYIADHGLSHVDKESEKVTLMHNHEYKQNFHVPFIRISSDDVQPTHQKTARSGYQFIHAFAQWLGIQEKNLQLPYDYFSETPANEEIKVFEWTEIVPYQILKDDPAILP